MNIDVLMKIVKKKSRIFLYYSYLIEVIFSLSSSVLIAEALSEMISAIIYQQNQDEITRKLTFFVCVSLGLIFLSVVNKFNLFFRTKKTAYCIENEVYNYFFKVKYYDNIKKDEMQANITKTLIEYNSLYFSTISLMIGTSVTVVASVIYSIIITPYSLVVFAFMFIFLMIILKGKFDNIPEIRGNITKYNNDLYRNLWEGIENLEIEQFLNFESIFSRYKRNIKSLVKNRIEYNRIMVRADFLAQFGNIASIILMVLLGMTFYGFNVNSISKILPLLIIIPSVSTGIFTIPSLITNSRNIKGIKKYLNSYFIFECSNELEISELEKIHIDSLKIENVVFSYNNIHNILDGVTFELKRGQITTFIGENGCGKSTLFKICALLIPIKTGRFCICNEEGKDWIIDSLNDFNEDYRKQYWKQIHYIESLPRIIPASLEKNIILNDLYDESRFVMALKKAGLKEFEKRDLIDVRSISDGEAQKIVFARIFYHKYDIIFLDESTSHMDPQAEEKIMCEFKEFIKKENIIVAAVSHKDSFNKYSDKIYKMEQGKISILL